MQPVIISIVHETARINATPAQLRDHSCVYSHTIINPDNEELFYIGIVKLHDVFKHADAHRNNVWRATITDDTALKITIMFSSISIPECNKIQAQLVAVHRPRANTQGYPTTGPVVITCTQGTNIGKTYRNQSEAAKANGLHQPTLSNHLNGVIGYETIHGMKFKRGM